MFLVRSQLGKGALVVVGALVCSTLLIQASDTWRFGSSSLLGSVSDGFGPCGEHAAQYRIDGALVCIDRYEASADEQCPYPEPNSPDENTSNVTSTQCRIHSAPGKPPLRFVTFAHAEQYCARVSKRLLTPREWYVAVRDVHDWSNCVVDSPYNQPYPTGSVDCANSQGVYDLIGNVWEWVDAQIVEGVYEGRSVPRSGYIQLADRDGVVLETGATSSALFDDVYALTNTSGVRGMIRGGYYGSGTDAGRYVQNLSVPLDISTAGIGFRCVRDL